MSNLRNFAAMITVCISFTRPACAEPSMVLRAATEYPATTMPGIGLLTFAEQVRSQTSGKLEVVVVHDSPLNARAALGAVRDGRVDIGDIHAGPLGTDEPIFNLVVLPFVASSAADTRCLQEVTREVYARRFDALGVHLLYSAPWPATGLWSAIPVVMLDDLKRLNVRTYDATSEAFLASLGVRAKNMPMGRAIPLIADGTYTAVMSSGDGGAGQRLWQHLRYFTALNYAAPLSFAVLKKSVYEQLPHEVRLRVDAAARDTEAQLWQVMRDRQAINRRAMYEHGVEVSETLAPPFANALRDAAEHVVDAWIAGSGTDGKSLLERYRSSLVMASARGR